jgi:hypothetical protein
MLHLFSFSAQITILQVVQIPFAIIHRRSIFAAWKLLWLSIQSDLHLSNGQFSLEALKIYLILFILGIFEPSRDVPMV